MAKVELIGVTEFRHPTGVEEYIDDAEGAQALIEFSGRACYQSFHRPNPSTGNNKDYIANIINLKHFSVLEHSQATFYITEVPRSLTHEFIRHRHFSYSEVSQRYVNVESYDEIAPPDTVGLEDTSLWYETEDLFVQANALYKCWADKLERDGYTRKEARQAARFVLPEAKETRIVVTGNFRSWLEFNEKRNSEHADKAIADTARQIHNVLSVEFPNVFNNSEVLPDE